MADRRYYTVAVLVMAAAFFAWNFTTASGDMLNQSMGYVSDDIWYVSSSRNTLREFWSLQPRAFENGEVYATILAFNNESYAKALEALKRPDQVFKIVKDDYEKSLGYSWTKAIAVLASIETLKEVGEIEMVKVFQGYRYPDHQGILQYMNYEHPPLVRYVLGFTMLIDDRPLVWRIPSLILGSAILVLAYLVAGRIFGQRAGIAAAIFVFTEPTVRAMSMVAMLDIYLSFFTILALYLALAKRYYIMSALTIGFAAAAKMPGFFAIPALMVSFIRKRNKKELLPLAILIPILVYVAISIPVILHLGGLNPWVSEVLNALRWHTTPRPEGPPTTNPLGLLYGAQPFPISVTPTITAGPNFLLTLLVIPLTFFIAPLAIKGVVKGAGTALAWFWSTYLGFVIVFLAGNTTLYSFYAVQFTPLAAVIGGGLIYLINNPGTALEALKTYPNLLRRTESAEKNTEPV